MSGGAEDVCVVGQVIDDNERFCQDLSDQLKVGTPGLTLYMMVFQLL